jgi:PAS domain S-box-containing protein
VIILFQRLFLVCLASVALAVHANDSQPGASGRAAAANRHGAIGVGSWNTTVEYKDIVVTGSDGAVLYQSDLANQGTNGWYVFRGSWNARDGKLGQTGIMTDCRITTGSLTWSNYTVSLRARKTGGQEGFLLLFNWLDDGNFAWFNVGHWGGKACIEQFVDGAGKILGGQIPQTVEANVWYDLRVVVRGPRIECYVNERLIEAVTVTEGSVAVEQPVPMPSSPAAPHGAIGVGSWNTTVEYQDIVVTSNNLVLYRSDFADEGTKHWKLFDGSWSARDGVLAQTAIQKNCRAILGPTNWANYTITLRARKTGGNEGFLVLFNWLDDRNFTWFNVGRWGGTACVEQYVDGNSSILGNDVPQAIENDIWYDLQVVVTGPRVECYVNGTLILDMICQRGRVVQKDLQSPGLPEPDQIHTAGEFLALSGNDAVRGRAVHAEGVAIYANPAEGEVLFKDHTGVIPVAMDLSQNPIQPGTPVVLDGWTSAEPIHYPDHPSGRQYLPTFEAPINVDDMYFARVRGYLHPPRTGEYQFWVASDNGSELWLSPDEDPRHAKKIADINAFAYAPFHGWDHSTNQQSTKIVLEAGRKYYIEALHCQQVGEDFLSVAWEGPGLPRAVIDGAFLSPPDDVVNPGGTKKTGSILREFWLNYPFFTDAEAEAWNSLAAAAGHLDIGWMMKNPPTHYGNPLITEARLTPLDRPLPPARPVKLEQPWTAAEDFERVEVEGMISQLASADDYTTTLELTDQGRQLTVRLANPRQENFNSWVNARVRIRGFCEGALAANGERVASLLWVPDIQDISIAPPAEEDWARLPLVSVHDLNSTKTTAKAGQRIRIAGEWKAGSDDFLVVRDGISLFSASFSTNGNNWSQITSPVEVPMKYSAYSGIATYGLNSNQCSVTYDHLSASLFPGSSVSIGNPQTPGRIQGNEDHLAIIGNGKIGGRAGFDTLHPDDAHFLYRHIDGDGELVARVAAISVDANPSLGGGSGLMIRESLDPKSKMVYLCLSTLSGIDLRIRRNTGNPIDGFPAGTPAPCWLKLVRQSFPPVKVYGAHFANLPTNQPIEAMGVLEYTNQEWSLHDAFVRTPSVDLTEPSPTAEITTIQQIGKLGADELQLWHPASIRGVIVARPDDIYVQDDTGGIRIPSSRAQKFAGLKVGQQIHINGHCAPGDFSPILEPSQQPDAVTLLGKGRMPKPITPTWIQFMQGRQDAQWVEVKGVIRSIHGQTLKIQVPGGDILADLGFNLPASQRKGLIDSSARIQGVCRVTANERRQITGVRLIVPKADFIFVDELAPADPFAVAARPINRLRLPGDQTEAIHRVKIEGVVTYFHDGVAYIQDATAGIEVAAGAIALARGDWVEVLGFPDSDGSAVDLADAVIRKTATGALPAPEKLETGLPQPAQASRLVAMSAVFLGHSTLLDNDVLQLQSRDRIFQGLLPQDGGALPELELGSLVHLTGVCRTIKDPTGKYSETSPGFELLLSAPADVVLLHAPPWWNWRRLVWIGGTFTGAMAIAAAWIAMILRKNRLLGLAQRQLQTANEELEHRVEVRTGDLAKANTELRHEQALLRTLLDTASDYIYFKDAESRFVRCSLSMCSRSQLTHEQIVGRTDFDIFREEHARKAFADEQNILRTGQPLIGQLEKEVHHDNAITWVMSTKMPWRDAKGKIIGTFGISRDITPLKEAEARLEQVHRQLVDASRAAGQAEVAASVIHNVGNVLNSMNISASIIQSSVQESRFTASVARVADLLKQHQHDLAAFFSQEGPGRQLPTYLQGLAEKIASEQAGLLEEIGSLIKNVDHIKTIVAMQQNYARPGGVVELHSIPSLVEDALRVHASAMAERQIRVVRQFEPARDLLVDKHRVLQILVNLISNANWALLQSPGPERVLTMVVSPGNNDGVSVSVADNGIGISAENLNRLFRHGFTTRPDGHGFGLHSSILAARELGGNLLARSDGPGCGAVFTLEIPGQPNRE